MSQPRETTERPASEKAESDMFAPSEMRQSSQGTNATNRSVHDGHLVAPPPADAEDIESRLRQPVSTGASALSGIETSEGHLDLPPSPKLRSNIPTGSTAQDGGKDNISEVSAEDMLLAMDAEDLEILAGGGNAKNKKSSSPAMNFSMQDLFGDIFHPPDTEVVPDPKHFDARQMISELFGVDENILNRTDISKAELRRLKEEHQLDANFDDIRDVFGEQGLEALHSDTLGKNISSVIHASLPKRGDGSNRFLITMPQVGGCVQTLHAEPKKFDKLERPRVSTKTEHYTASNTMRWTMHKGKAYTNSRLILWSDGSRTLHIGPDIFEARTNTESSLNVVTSDIQLEGRNGVTAPGKATSLQYTDHLVFTTPARITNSVNEGIAHTSNIVQDVQTMVPLIEGTVAPIGVAKDKNPPKGATAPIEEQYLEALRMGQEKERGKRAAGITELIEDEFNNYAQLEGAIDDESLANRLDDIRKENELKKRQREIERENRREQLANQKANGGGYDAGDGGATYENDDFGSEGEGDGNLQDMMDKYNEKKRSRSPKQDDDELEELLASKSKKSDLPEWKQKYIKALDEALSKITDNSDAEVVRFNKNNLLDKPEYSEDDWQADLQKLGSEILEFQMPKS